MLCRKDTVDKNAPYRDILYDRWTGILDRCYNPKCPAFDNYGGKKPKPVKVCPSWKNNLTGFKTFYNWSIKHGFNPLLSIDRKDFNGNYSPKNCQWITMYEQAQNRSDVHMIYDDGRYFSLTSYTKIHNDTINIQTIYKRIKRGIPPYIAMYYKDKIIDDWLIINKNNLRYILEDILVYHPNLIEDNTIDLMDYIDSYLAKYIDNYEYEPITVEEKPAINLAISKNIKIWDKTRYIDLKDYCNKYKDTIYDYDIALTRIKAGFPPCLALYFEVEPSNLEAWVIEYGGFFSMFLIDIFTAHPNLVKNKTIPLYEYISEYLYRWEKYWNENHPLF